MLLIVFVAGAAALLVLVHARLRQTWPDVATLASRRVQRLAAVVLVLAKAADGLVEALQATRPQGRHRHRLALPSPADRHLGRRR